MSKQYQEQKKKWFEQGKRQATSDILEKIDEKIDIQNKMLDNTTETNLRASIKWRIIGLEELKQKIQGVKGE